MLQLKNITKTYLTGDNEVHALNDVSLSFRKSEFVSILGPSGCGKTTLLNIIGGLDRYTSGDIIINGRSTKDYKDKDWDSYRNHSVGFVFQSYNLIPHQSVLKNVELALTLSGIKREERRERAKLALEKVGLGDQLNKKPNQMSGGQMQRVAIARAIVNNPDIILADEPTGALDTETSIQVMEILKEISKTKLVVMVTHNPDLANQYSTRIINLSDGKITGDTMPQEFVEETPDDNKEKKPSMSFWTAFSLSLNNLFTKKARTILTSFAGSIGIIGIALILSLSAGFNAYISKVQNETLLSYPLTIEKVSVDYTNLIETMLGSSERDTEKFPNTTEVTTQNAIAEMVQNVSSSASMNDLKSFKKYLDENLNENLYSDIKYSYNLNFTTYLEQKNVNTSEITVPKDEFNQIYPTKLPPVEELVSVQIASGMASYYTSFASLLTSQPAWGEIIGDQQMIENQYDFLAGSYPTDANGLILVVDQYNQLSDLTLFQLGLLTKEDISYIFNDMVRTTFAVMPVQNANGDFIGENGEVVFKYAKAGETSYWTDLNGNPVDLRTAENQAKLTVRKWTTEESKAYLEGFLKINRAPQKFTFDDLLKMEYSIVLDTDLYKENGVKSLGGVDSKLYAKMNDAEIQEYLKNNSAKLKISGIARLKDGITNGGISGAIGYTSELVNELIEKNNDNAVYKAYVNELENAKTRAGGSDNLDMMIVNIFTGEPINQATYNAMANGTENSPRLNAIDVEDPTSISIYPTSFENKDAIIDFIKDYNDSVEEEKQINYTDFIGMMMSSITVIVNAITYILIAFVSISLVVSSIMIGIITYISVLERTKEIGVLRSIGASKRDIKRVFNAETMIIGLVSGLLGILITLVLNVPINIIINALAGIAGVASLPVIGAISLIVISVLLTTVAGLFPASMASKKDPVIALRTE